MSDLVVAVHERAAIIKRLIATDAAWRRWQSASVRPPNILEDAFAALADAGDFNRRHPEIAIPSRAQMERT